jgi:hypothetical protein
MTPPYAATTGRLKSTSAELAARIGARPALIHPPGPHQVVKTVATDDGEQEAKAF